jgi:carbon-monoxide dehydrogenase iron sulfur subunit
LKNQIKIMAEKCSGCRVCQLMCSMTHHKGAFNPRWATIRVEIDRNIDLDTPVSMIDTPHVCRQCEPAPCVEACPEAAFKREGEDDVWRVDGGVCTGCGLCKEACPFDMIVIHNEIAAKCDFCNGNPTCINYCPTGALGIE